MSKNSLPVDLPKTPESNKYETQEALRTLARADEIRRNRPLMKDVKILARSHAKVVGSKRK